MAENKNAKKAAAAAAATEEQDATPSEHARREKKKSRWTLDTCMHAAKRFTTRDDWSHGAPSSYKAAVAKGWDTKCCAHMTVKTAGTKMTKSVAAKTTTKVSPMTKKKAPGKMPKAS